MKKTYERPTLTKAGNLPTSTAVRTVFTPLRAVPINKGEEAE